MGILGNVDRPQHILETQTDTSPENNFPREGVKANCVLEDTLQQAFVLALPLIPLFPSDSKANVDDIGFCPHALPSV
jgi:hypothetical protein